MGSTVTQEKTIQSTQTAFDIIEVIAERDRPSISEIAEVVDYSRSTVHYHLKTLERNRYVVRNEEGLRLGLRMARLGDLALRKHRPEGVVEKPADDLAAETDATAHVAVAEGGDRCGCTARPTTSGATSARTSARRRTSTVRPTGRRSSPTRRRRRSTPSQPTPVSRR